MIIGIIIGISLLLIVIIAITVISCYNKFQFAIIKINEAEKNTDLVLEKKKEYLDRLKPLIKEEIDEKNFLNNLEELDIKKENHFQTNSILADFYIELMKTIDENEKLLNNEQIANLIEDLSDNELDLIASIKYYNDNVVEFNKLIVSFPSNIIRIFFRYKKKEFYKDEKREMYEILNDK